MSLNLVFSVAFAAIFERIGWAPHGGLALANSVATALEMVGLLVLMRSRLKGLDGRKMVGGISRSAAATLIMSSGLWIWMNQTNGQPAWLVASGGVILGAGIFALAALLLRVEEARELLDFALRRLRG
jgi:putative peptidoglycan lipid II flippase